MTTDQRLEALVSMVDRLNEAVASNRETMEQQSKAIAAINGRFSEYRNTVRDELTALADRVKWLENTDDAAQLQELRSSLDRLHYLNDRVAYAGANPDPD